MKIKKLSEYKALEGLTIMGKLSRAISPFAKNKKFMDKLKACFDPSNQNNTGLSRAVAFADIIELITSDAPELLLDIVSIMSGEDKERVSESNLLEIAGALIELSKDEQLAGFLSKHFSLVVKE